MNIKKLKQMIAEPASKEWFAKHGSPKQKALQHATKPHKMTAREKHNLIIHNMIEKHGANKSPISSERTFHSIMKDKMGK